MSYKYDPYRNKFEHIPDEQSNTAYISTNATCPSQVYQIVYLADECIDKIADVVVRKIWSAIIAERSAFKHDIADAPTIEPQQGWIPCKTALPEKGQYVLCQCRAGIMDVLHLTDDNGWYKDSTHIYMHGFVLAWMPLPEPWKGEKDG